MFTEEMINQMRREVEHPEIMKARIEREKQEREFVENTKKMFIAEGRDFDKEFAEWERNRRELNYNEKF